MSASVDRWLRQGRREMSPRSRGDTLPLVQAAAAMGRSEAEVRDLALGGMLDYEMAGDVMRVRPKLIAGPRIRAVV